MDTAGIATNSPFTECADCSELYADGVYSLLVIVFITNCLSFVVMFHLNFASGPFLLYIILSK